MERQGWSFDLAHSSVNFSARHMVISKVRGTFSRWKGTLEFDERRPEAARVEAHIEAASVDTHEPQRDAHLRSADFLDAEKYPEIVFKSTRVAPAGGASDEGARYRVEGELTIHGVTRPVALDAEFGGRGKDPWGGERIGFTATATINRKDFGLTWNQALETGGVLVGERIEITLEIQAVAAAAASA